ncbi:hypothetical protein M3Y96_00988500 [Aphelenchoides besseyi]|nr:hypothetical protein M3Y96_00988500 [Aphelenchoides besseyi]
MNVQNLTIHSPLLLNRFYLPEASTNLFAALLGIPLNFWIVRVGWRYRKTYLKCQFSHGVYNFLQLSSGDLDESDICGYSLVIPRSIAVWVEPIQPAVIVVGVFLDLLTLLFLHRYPNDHQFRFSKEFWIVVTFLSILSYSLNGILTVTFIRNFRQLFLQTVSSREEMNSPVSVTQFYLPLHTLHSSTIILTGFQLATSRN